MIHIAVLLFAYAGFAAICGSMAKHQVELLGRKLEGQEPRRLRLAGSASLSAAYACAAYAKGWKFGAVEWFGAIMLAAVALTLLLAYRPRRAGQAAPGAAFVAAMLLASALLISIR